MPSAQREPTMAYATPKNTQKKPNLFQLGHRHMVHVHFEQNRNFHLSWVKPKLWHDRMY